MIRSRAPEVPLARRDVTDDGEFVAANSRDHVPRLHRRSRRDASYPDQLIAGGMPNVSLTCLNPVQIEENKGDLALPPLHAQQRLFKDLCLNAARFGSPVNSPW